MPGPPKQARMPGSDKSWTSVVLHPSPNASLHLLFQSEKHEYLSFITVYSSMPWFGRWLLRGAAPAMWRSGS